MANNETAKNVAAAIRKHWEGQADVPAPMTPHPSIKGHAKEYATVVAKALEASNTDFNTEEFMRDCGLSD